MCLSVCLSLSVRYVSVCLSVCLSLSVHYVYVGVCRDQKVCHTLCNHINTSNLYSSYEVVTLVSYVIDYDIIKFYKKSNKVMYIMYPNEVFYFNS